MEKWKTIDGYGGKYKISDKGQVLSVARSVSNHTGRINKPDYILKPHKDAKGYMRVYLDENGKTKFVPIHRLVGMAFIENPEGKPQINHKDGDKTNNRVENLEWATNSENVKHAFETGLNRYTGKAGKPKKPVLQIDKITGNIIAEYASVSEAARALNLVTPSNIGACCRGKRKTIGGYKWKYREEVV